MSIEEHKKAKGKLEIISRMKIENDNDLAIAYTPGVGAVSLAVAKNPSLAREVTSMKHTVAVITDGSAVLGLGDIGPLASLPVMEGKSALFKRFADIDSVPICIDENDPDKIVSIIKSIAPTFGGINLEDISAPRCFEIEEKLKQVLDIPVFHDDQHGTAIVCLAGLINASKVVNKSFKDLKVVINGAGSAGIAIAKILINSGIHNLMLVDSKGITCKTRTDLNKYKLELAHKVDMDMCGSLSDALVDADVFIGVSKPGLLTKEMVQTMAKDPIVFAMANPIPEIMPDEAYEAGAGVVATGRSDFPNQINNVLVFPGIFKGAIEANSKEITEEMKLKAAHALAKMIENPTKDKIIPSPFDEGVSKIVANAVKYSD